MAKDEVSKVRECLRCLGIRSVKRKLGPAVAFDIRLSKSTGGDGGERARVVAMLPSREEK